MQYITGYQIAVASDNIGQCGGWDQANDHYDRHPTSPVEYGCSVCFQWGNLVASCAQLCVSLDRICWRTGSAKLVSWLSCQLPIIYSYKRRCLALKIIKIVELPSDCDMWRPLRPKYVWDRCVYRNSKSVFRTAVKQNPIPLYFRSRLGLWLVSCACHFSWGFHFHRLCQCCLLVFPMT